MRWLVACTVVLVASALIWLGTPRLIASILKAPAHAPLTRVAAGQTPPPEQLERAAAYLERAGRWEPSAQLNGELGFVRLLLAYQMGPSEAARGATARLAADNLRESLRLSPARPHPWVRLAYARDIAGSSGADIAGLLEQSTKVGAFVGEVALVRLKLLLKYWDSLSPDLRLYTFKQIRYMWANDQGAVLRAARQTSKPHIIRFALRTVPGALDRLDQVIPRRSA